MQPALGTYYVQQSLRLQETVFSNGKYAVRKRKPFKREPFKPFDPN